MRAALLVAPLGLGLGIVVGVQGSTQAPPPGSVAAVYDSLCANCHGPRLQGGGQGPSLVDDEWKHGRTDADIARVIRDGVAGTPMVSFRPVLSDQQIRALVIYVREMQDRARSGTLPSGPPPMPSRFESERHAFAVETVAV